MTIKLALLKSGEEVISDMTEMMAGPEENAQVVGYFLKHPCRAILSTPALDVDDEKEAVQKAVSIKLLPWMPLSKDENIPVVADWIISIVEPQPKLMELYKKALKTYEERKSENIGVSESATDTDSSGGSDD